MRKHKARFFFASPAPVSSIQTAIKPSSQQPRKATPELADFTNFFDDIHCLCSKELREFASGYSLTFPAVDPAKTQLFVETTRHQSSVISLARVDFDFELAADYQVLPAPGRTALLVFFCSICPAAEAAEFLRFIENTLRRRRYVMLQVRALLGAGIDFFLANHYQLWVPGLLSPVVIPRVAASSVRTPSSLQFQMPSADVLGPVLAEAQLLFAGYSNTLTATKPGEIPNVSQSLEDGVVLTKVLSPERMTRTAPARGTRGILSVECIEKLSKTSSGRTGVRPCWGPKEAPEKAPPDKVCVEVPVGFVPVRFGSAPQTSKPVMQRRCWSKQQGPEKPVQSEKADPECFVQPTF
jgi:hypothetical protein